VPGIERLLFSAEFLSPRDVVEKKAVDLLASTNSMLSLRVLYKDLQGDDFKAMMSTFRDHGIERNFIPWPMLDVDAGYYANVNTALNFII